MPQSPQQTVNQLKTAAGSESVAELFQANGWEQWWSNTGTQHFNVRPGANNCTEPNVANAEFGNDYNPSYKATIRSVTAGTVIYAQLPLEYYKPCPNGATSIGYVIQIRNADGSLIHYQHMLSTPLQVGNNVNVGDVVGVAGGCPQGAYSSNGCSSSDCWSTGPHIEVRYSAKENSGGQPWCNGNWVDPVPIIAKIVGAPSMTSSSSSSGSNLPTILQNIPNPFSPNADVAQVFAGIDTYLTLQNPIPPYQSVSLFGVSLPDPIMAYEFVQNVSVIFGVLILRFILYAAGVYICFKVFNHLVNVTGGFGSAVSGVAGGAAGVLPFIERVA